MIQDLGDHFFKNEFSLRRKAIDSDFVLVFKGREVYLKGNGKDSPLKFPRASNFDKSKLIYLFSIDDNAYFLYNGEPSFDPIDGFEWQSNLVLRSDNPRIECFAGFTAYHLYNWYLNNRYCGRCGSLTTHSTSERALICPNCNNIIYPKIAPAVIVGITDSDRIVVTRYKDRPYRGIALIAGFCEIGETPEQTAHREALEEVGLKIKDLKYCGSQPWGLDSNILFGFMAKVDGSTKSIRDDSELAEAMWMHRNEIKDNESTISLTKTMIENFRRNGY